MRLGEECPYITPCGWCSRKETPCDSGKSRKKQLPLPVISEIPAPPPPGEKKDSIKNDCIRPRPVLE